MKDMEDLQASGTIELGKPTHDAKVVLSMIQFRQKRDPNRRKARYCVTAVPRLGPQPAQGEVLRTRTRQDQTSPSMHPPRRRPLCGLFSVWLAQTTTSSKLLTSKQPSNPWIAPDSRYLAIRSGGSGLRPGVRFPSAHEFVWVPTQSASVLRRLQRIPYRQAQICEMHIRQNALQENHSTGNRLRQHVRRRCAGRILIK